MKAYVFQAALLCEDCGESAVARLTGSCEGEGHDFSDSDRFPQGPYADGGGEADCPQHCDSCSAFLENPLTQDGMAYVREACGKREGSLWPDVGPLAQWARFYGV